MLSQRRRGSAQPARNGRGSCVADRWLTVACGSAVADTGAFAVVVLIGAVVGLLAVLSNRMSERIHVPAPALFLVAAAAATRNNAGAGTWMRSLSLLDSTASNPTTAPISTTTANAPVSATALPHATVNHRSATQEPRPFRAGCADPRRR